MTIQLKPGDYTKRMNLSEEQAKAVSDAFVAAGAEYGLGYPHKDNPLEHIGWDPTTGRTNMWTGMWNKSLCVRELTLDQILGTTEPAWSGEGLPPVGVECEWRAGANEWKTGHIIARYEDRVWLTTGDNLKEQVWNLSVVEFRPIRTEEDKAIEQMKSVSGTSYVKPEHMEMITRALYRAGYRKTGEAK